MQFAPRPRAIAAAFAVLAATTTAVAPVTALADSESPCAGSGNAAYVAAAGDSWFAIAERAGTTVSKLLAANDAGADDVLLAGDTLCLPSGSTPITSCPGGVYTVGGGDSWFAIATGAGVPLASLLDSNGASVDRAIHPGDEICLPAGAKPAATGQSSSGGKTYTVAAGDSWFGIAGRASTTLRSLLEANDATERTVLLPGDRIRLPAGANQPSSSSAPSNAAIQLASAPVRATCWISDTWRAPRAGGRRHLGVDVLAAEGTYVRAVVDGKLTSRAWDQPGKRAGNAWTLTAADGTYYFYAHMLDFAPGLKVGSRVSAGDIIGFVGSTGNTDVSHLHFEVHPRGGSAINPYPIVRAVSDCGRAING